MPAWARRPGALEARGGKPAAAWKSHLPRRDMTSGRVLRVKAKELRCQRRSRTSGVRRLLTDSVGYAWSRPAITSDLPVAWRAMHRRKLTMKSAEPAVR